MKEFVILALLIARNAQMIKDAPFVTVASTYLIPLVFLLVQMEPLQTEEFVLLVTRHALVAQVVQPSNVPLVPLPTYYKVPYVPVLVVLDSSKILITRHVINAWNHVLHVIIQKHA
jgi:hypothetical protein